MFMTERKKRTALPYSPNTSAPTPEAVVARLYRDFPEAMAQLAAAEREEQASKDQGPQPRAVVGGRLMGDEDDSGSNP
jgi:hypothetical protein